MFVRQTQHYGMPPAVRPSPLCVLSLTVGTSDRQGTNVQSVTSTPEPSANTD